jgi:hypothetical protein
VVVKKRVTLCVILYLMFLSFYCDYIVDEFAVFCIFQKNSEIINFGGHLRPPKIVAGNFRRPDTPAANNHLFSTARCQPPKIIAYFRLFFWWPWTAENRPKAAENDCSCCSDVHHAHASDKVTFCNLRTQHACMSSDSSCVSYSLPTLDSWKH